MLEVGSINLGNFAVCAANGEVVKCVKSLGFVQFFGGGCTYIFGQLGVQTSLDVCIHW